MAELPEDMAEALYLMYFEDLSYEEIARVMKRTKKQVDNLLYRGKQRLRAILEEGGIDP
jgi:RNA polymerase sigma-70 factor (ECF subfamily)